MCTIKGCMHYSALAQYYSISYDFLFSPCSFSSEACKNVTKNGKRKLLSSGDPDITLSYIDNFSL